MNQVLDKSTGVSTKFSKLNQILLNQFHIKSYVFFPTKVNDLGYFIKSNRVKELCLGSLYSRISNNDYSKK